MKIIPLITVAGLVISMVASAEMDHSTMNHKTMDHSQSTASATLTEAGTDAFATLQEAIVALNANPDTDWKKVNLEALRQHLVEMQDMTLNVSVTQKPIKNGFQAVVTPINERAKQSLTKVLSAHPAQMRAETGWDMQVRNNNAVFTLTVTTKNAAEIDKIRGLGYIGMMAYGNHHQPHHWSMASGDNPHAGH